jgi:cation transport ATPase
MTRRRNGRFIVLGLVGITILIYLLGCATDRPDLAELGSEGSEVRIYEVFGMDCPGCHGGLEDLVNKIPEVITSKANWEKQQLQVVMHPIVEVEDDVIYEAIKQANFTPGKRLK